MKTFSAKAETVQRDWHVVDAAGKTLGRLSSEIARRLRGKHKPVYTPHVDTGDYIVVINADKVAVTGNKLEDKYYRYHTGWFGGLKEVQYKHLMANNPEKAMMLAIKGMLPGSSLGRTQLTRVRIYKGAEHNHAAQKPAVWEL